MTVASEMVDEILDYMLDGWYFGETQSLHTVAGYVPSIKPDGNIKPGQDQIKAIGAAVQKIKKRNDAKKKGIITDDSQRGTGLEKSIGIESDAQFRIRDLKVARDGNDHEHMLNETETTLKFGLFVLTLMYFRAMTYLSREKKTWSGEVR
jgi:hypothetical protein